MMKNIIFDIDGTLIDTEYSILTSLQKVLLEEEGRQCSLEDLRFCLGIPGTSVMSRLKPKDPQRLQYRWNQEMNKHTDSIKPFDGILEVLETLKEKGIKMGIVTSKTQEEFDTDFKPFGINHYFDSIINANHTEKHKPHPEPLLKCMEEMGAAKEETVYIGDTVYDMDCAKGADVKFGLALWGSKTTEGFDKADFILKETREILNLIK